MDKTLVNQVIAHKLALSYSWIGSIAEVWPIVDPYHRLCSVEMAVPRAYVAGATRGMLGPLDIVEANAFEDAGRFRHIDGEHDSPAQVILIERSQRAQK
jgi:hypothetical protein